MLLPAGGRGRAGGVPAAGVSAAEALFAQLRALIHETARETEGVGELAESVKWGEPSFAPARPRIGSSVRLTIRDGETVAMLFICHTHLVDDFRELYPDITLSLVVTDSDVDLAMRQADVAIRLHRPTQPDLVQRRLMTVHTHIYGGHTYLERHGIPETVGDLDAHALIAYGDQWQPPVPSLNWILAAGRDEDEVHGRAPALTVNNVYGMLRACECGLGLASLPDYLGGTNARLRRILPTLEGPSFTAYFVYPEELRASKRVSVFRDFLLRKVAEQPVW